MNAKIFIGAIGRRAAHLIPIQDSALHCNAIHLHKRHDHINRLAHFLLLLITTRVTSG
jgi:hypothetical protein